jgi:glycosyltransferase involved in cell wall biosynthesis
VSWSAFWSFDGLSDRRASTMRIGILAEGLAEWQGGIDFLRMICDCLRLVLAKDPLAMVLLYPRTPTLEAVQRVALPWQRWLAESARRRKLQPWREILNKQWSQSSSRRIARVKDVMGSEVPVLRFLGDEELDTLARVQRLDCLLPSFRALSKCVRTPWIGYLYDFQHRHLPHLFSDADRAARDVQFAAMAKSARHVLVNSRAVQSDCLRFLGVQGAKFVPLPFGAAPMPDWLADQPALVAKYNLPQRYFLVSNQFWTHKNHRLVFEALHILAQTPEGADVAVVCTGSIVDERDSSYFPSLQRYLRESGIADRVRILDYIPKRDQIEIMKRAMAVVQPTLFEGGPGGGAVYDAVSLGVPALLSDIPVNRELDAQGLPIRFFDPSNAAILAELMLDHVRGPQRGRKGASILISEGQERRAAVGKALVETLQAAGVILS